MASNQLNAVSSVAPAVFRKWKYRNYFQYVKSSDKNAMYKCQLCKIDKTLSSSTTSASTLKRHLANVHRDVNLEEARSASSIPAKRCKKENPEAVKMLILRYLVEDCRPFSTVDSLAFRNLLCGIAGTNISIPCRSTMILFLNETAANMRINLKKRLSDDTKYVSTSADIWSVDNRSFLGVKVHYINSNLERESAAIVCCRFRWRHTYDAIAETLHQVHVTWGIEKKIVSTVTDNASNFGSDELEEEVNFTNLTDVLSVEDKLYNLPTHHRCAAHTLNVIATADVSKYINSLTAGKEFVSLYRSTFAKCTAIWNTFSRSVQAAEMINGTIGKQLIVPVDTRWNSLYDSVACFSEIPAKKINLICEKLDLSKFTKPQIIFIIDYCKFFKPVAVGLDKLQADNIFYGSLLPILRSLLARMENEREKVPEYMHGLLDVITSSVLSRFSTALSSKSAILASLSHPAFKLRWVKEEDKENYKKLFMDEAAALHSISTSSSTNSNDQYDDDFFLFPNNSTTSEDSESQVIDFLRSKETHIQSLDDFPAVKEVFLKYNTSMPSGAPVEHLFTAGGFIITPSTSGLSDVNFENLLLLRQNGQFF